MNLLPLSEMPAADLAEIALKGPSTSVGGSLSPGERVRVRANVAPSDGSTCSTEKAGNQNTLARFAARWRIVLVKA